MDLQEAEAFGKEMAEKGHRIAAGENDLIPLVPELVLTPQLLALVEFYRWLSRQPLGPEGGDLVRSLLKIEETHIVELKKTKAMDYF